MLFNILLIIVSISFAFIMGAFFGSAITDPSIGNDREELVTKTTSILTLIVMVVFSLLIILK